jgi:hypothetical protein
MQEDGGNRDAGMEVAYIQSHKSGPNIQCTWWYKQGDCRNGRKLLPGKPKTRNRGYLFAMRELLKSFRKRMEQVAYDDQTFVLIVKTDATYIEDGVNVYRYRWRRSGWANKRGKKIANSIFWRSVDHELDLLNDMGIEIKVERHPLPFRFK